MNKSKILGWSVLFFIIYCTTGAAVYFVSLLLLQRGELLDVPWIVSAQRSLYRGGMVNVNSWLSQPNCIRPDSDLIYIPSNGTCRFDDIEFKTTLNFTDEGRDTGVKPEGPGIAVIGDSHAMGWGVNDQETFSAQLQKLTKRPVYNLGVASYGTARELIRLEKSGVLGKVDTVIIQYCNNDKSENLQFDSASHEQLHEKVFGRVKPDGSTQPNKLKFIARGYWLTLAAPFKSLADKLRRKSFTPHYGPFIATIQKHYSALKGKRVIVFYSNPFGQKYRNYPSGWDKQLSNVYFVDLDLDWHEYHKLDNHLTPAGHQKVAERLLKYLQVAH
jgi:lysophospholipase L1-like esterase